MLASATRLRTLRVCTQVIGPSREKIPRIFEVGIFVYFSHINNNEYSQYFVSIF